MNLKYYEATYQSSFFLLDFNMKYTVYKRGNIHHVLFLTLLPLLSAGKFSTK